MLAILIVGRFWLLSDVEPRFEDLVLDPKQINSVIFYRSIDEKTHRLKESIKLSKDDGKDIWLNHRRAKKQLIHRAGLKISSIRRMDNYEERNKLILDHLHAREDPLVFKMERRNGMTNVYAVVTKRFTTVPNKEVFGQVEKILDDLKLEWKAGTMFETGRGLWKEYSFPTMKLEYGDPKVGDVVKCGCRIRTANTGDSAIIAYPFYKVLVCMNGLMSHKALAYLRRPHMGEKQSILEQIRSVVQKALDSMTEIVEQIKMAKKVTFKDKQEMINFLYRWKRVPKLAKATIVNKIEKDSNVELTLWGLSQIITWCATHQTVRADYRIDLQQLGSRALILDQKEVAEVLAKEPIMKILVPVK